MNDPLIISTVTSVPVWRQSGKRKWLLTSHRNNENTALSNILAPESLNTSQTQHKHVGCVWGLTFPLISQCNLIHYKAQASERAVWSFHIWACHQLAFPIGCWRCEAACQQDGLPQSLFKDNETATVLIRHYLFLYIFFFYLKRHHSNKSKRSQDIV